MRLIGSLSSESSSTVFTEIGKISRVRHLVLLQMALLLERLGTVNASEPPLALIVSMTGCVVSDWRHILDIGLDLFDGQRVGQATLTPLVAVVI